MSEIAHRTVKTNGINVHIAEVGEGPLVLMVHGFPELWYSWRHQLPALAAAGYHAVAPDVRGYGGSDAPPEIGDYSMKNMVADIIGLVDALGEDKAVIAGHDWGSPIAWNTAVLHPDRFRAVISMSVPYLPRSPMPPLQMMKAMFQGKFFYILYFQEPGVAESEFESDVRRSMRLFMYAASGDARNHSAFADAATFANKPTDSLLFDGAPEPGDMPWLTAEDLDTYVAAFEKSGFRGPLNRYRCMDIDWEQLPQLQDAKITQPALFIYGDHDGVMSFAPMDPMKNLVTNLQIVKLEGAGHWTQQERPAEVNDAMLAFLKGLP
ncbi:MAG TPA: alpha/beta hydrolase [Dehalococcoidia bacterium]|nr:alpha/beta hydrolase [Dehalococcoidia bacterium]